MKKTNLFMIGVLMLGLSAFILSCNSNTTAPKEEPVVEAPKVEEPAPKALSDAQIASIAVTANQIDVDYGKIALQRTKNPEVKEFAQLMINAHEDVIKKAVDLATKLGVTPEDNPTTQSLLQGQKDMNIKFGDLKGKDFDKVYIDNEVGYHKFAIDAVENTLIPNCTNAELKELLQTALPVFKGHLTHAEMVQAKLSK